MSKQSKRKQASSNFVLTIRDHENKAVAANVFRGNTADGFTYLYFELSRAWKTKSGKSEGYSAKFYSRNAAAIARVANEAAAWIEANPTAADGPVSISENRMHATVA